MCIYFSLSQVAPMRVQGTYLLTNMVTLPSKPSESELTEVECKCILEHSFRTGSLAINRDFIAAP